MPLGLVGNHLFCLHMVKALSNIVHTPEIILFTPTSTQFLEYLLSSSLCFVVWLYTLGHAYKLECGWPSISLHTARSSPNVTGKVTFGPPVSQWLSRGAFCPTSDPSPTLAFSIAHQSDLPWDDSSIREGSLVGFEFDLFLAKFPC